MDNQALFTDLYELTMAAAYFADKRQTESATFDLFVRRMPLKRNYLVFAGLNEVLNYLHELHFDPASIDYLRSLNLFSEDFLNYLKNFAFSGDVESLEEGEIFFAGEPIIKVTAPIIEAQIIETALINYVHIYTLIASKASRVIRAADGRIVIDFGARRSHGTYAAKAAAYAAYLTGATGTSNLLAGKEYDIPVFGTMAHSFIQTYDHEEEAFAAFIKNFPTNNTLLIDTYDVIAGAKKVVKTAQSLQDETISAVRIDSGDLGDLSVKVRDILNDGGLKSTKIIVSGDLDEYAIADFVSQGFPIDGFGVGTRMDISMDEPSLDMVYKLSQIESSKRIKLTMKLSPGKSSLPGRKQVLRVFSNGKAHTDIVGLEAEQLHGKSLLKTVMKNGQPTQKPKTWKKLRADFKKRLQQFPSEILSLDSNSAYPVEISKKLLQEIRLKH